MSDIQFDKVVKELMRIQGTTMKELAAGIMMSESGLAKTLKYNILKVETLQKIADYFEVPIVYFFGNYKDLNDQLLKALQENSKLKEENKELKDSERNSISIFDLEELKTDLKKHVKNGEGLVNFGFDIIEGKFFTQYEKLEKGKKPE